MKKYYIEAPVKLKLEENLKKLNIAHGFVTEDVPKGSFGLLTDTSEDKLVAAMPEPFNKIKPMVLTKEVAYDKWARLKAMINEDGERACFFTIED